MHALRQQFHLDGPLDVDWIFGNEVLTGREQRLYVDYIEDEQGQRWWTGPAEASAIEDKPFRFPPPRSRIVEMVMALRRLGVLSEEGLKATRDAWDGIAVPEQMRWEEVSKLSTQVLANVGAAGREYVEDDARDLRLVLEHWTFPLNGLDLSQAKVDLDGLREERDRRLAEEYGLVDELDVED